MPTQTQNIIDFYNTAQDKDFARQFQFRVSKIANTNFSNSELVYLETAALPGRSITNVQVPFMGLQFNVPGTATYPGSDAWNVVFRCDSNYDIRTTLENATFNTFDDSVSEGTYSIPRNSSDVVLYLLGKDPDIVVREYTLVGAYIVSVGESQYNLGDSGQIVTIPATIAYQYWRVTGQTTYTPPVVTVADNIPVTNRAK